jgi:hypothetical protein
MDWLASSRLSGRQSKGDLKSRLMAAAKSRMRILGRLSTLILGTLTTVLPV